MREECIWVDERYISNEPLHEQLYAFGESCATVFQPCGTHNTARRVDFVLLHSKILRTWPTHRSSSTPTDSLQGTEQS